jgi:hypothetical protein
VNLGAEKSEGGAEVEVVNAVIVAQAMVGGKRRRWRRTPRSEVGQTGM